MSNKKSAGCPRELISTDDPLTIVTLLAVVFFGGSNWGNAGDVHAKIVPAITAPIAARKERSLI